MWLGVSDTDTEGVWHAADGTQLDFLNWAPGMPDGGAVENCVEMWTTQVWNDATCTDAKAYACEIPSPPAELLPFECSGAVLGELRQVGYLSQGATAPMCRYQAFGLDGRRPSNEKHDFSRCWMKCRDVALGATVAQPRSAIQRQYLARMLRHSGDDSMWVGLEPADSDKRGWRWLAGGHGGGEPLISSQASWAAGQPDELDLAGQCVEMWPDGTWNDRACSGDFWTNKVCACELPVLDGQKA